MPTPNINSIIEWVEREYPDLPRIQTTNCRKIAGSNTWSQHSWANAADIFVSKAVGDELAPRLRATFGEHIKALLWQVTNHFDHIHVDTWPTGTGTPPCGGGTLTVRHKDGTKGVVFTDDIKIVEQGGDEDMATAQEVWFFPIPDEDDGLGTRGAAHALRQAWGFSKQAATDAAISRRLVEQLALVTLTTAQIEAIADEVVAEIKEQWAK